MDPILSLHHNVVGLQRVKREGLVKSGLNLCPGTDGAKTGYTREKDFRLQDFVNE